MIVENRGIGNTSHLLKGEDFFNAVYDLLAHHGKSSGNLFADNVPVFSMLSSFIQLIAVIERKARKASK